MRHQQYQHTLLTFNETIRILINGESQLKRILPCNQYYTEKRSKGTVLIYKYVQSVISNWSLKLQPSLKTESGIATSHLKTASRRNVKAVGGCNDRCTHIALT